MIERRQLLISGAALCAASAIPTRAFAAPALQDDIAILREILETLHPGLYRYSTPSAMARNFARLDWQWRTYPSIEQRYLHLSHFLATIRCGHSFANFANQRKAVNTALFDRPTRLPFAFRWVGDAMIITRDQSGTDMLPRGAIVHLVNGIPTQTMLKTLLRYTRADGGNDAKRRALLSIAGFDTIETFDAFHGLIYGTRDGSETNGDTAHHILKIRKPNAPRDSQIELPALTLAQRQGFRKQTDYRGDKPVWDWTMRADDVAVLTMDGWALYDSTWNWEDWLNERLDSLKGAKGLIIDIRENEGGMDCGDIILARLAKRDIVRPKFNQLVRYQKIPETLNPFLDTWDDSFRDWGHQAERFDERFYRLTKWDDGGILAAKGPRVDVPVAVLTSAQNSSATFQFAQLCHRSGLATLVGETTGGNQRGINGGAFFFARLPQSKLEFDLPLVGYFPEGKQPDAGIIPDIAVIPTVIDIMSERDRQMEIAVRALSRR